MGIRPSKMVNESIPQGCGHCMVDCEILVCCHWHLQLEYSRTPLSPTIKMIWSKLIIIATISSIAGVTILEKFEKVNKHYYCRKIISVWKGKLDSRKCNLLILNSFQLWTRALINCSKNFWVVNTGSTISGLGLQWW